jgi:hypothetical protein
MACSNPTVHWSGASFAAAPQLYSDAALTTVAPAGWYSFGGFAREMSAGGVLGPVQPCSSCIVPCGGGLSFSQGDKGLFSIAFDMGTAPGAAVITFSSGVLNTTMRAIPDALTWTYNGISSSEGSSLVGGYQTGQIGSPDGPPNGATDCNLTAGDGSGGTTLGSITASSWDASINNFVNTGTVNVPAITGIQTNANGFSGTSPSIYSLESTLLDWNCTQLGTIGCGTTSSLNIPASPFTATEPIAPNLASAVGTKWPVANGEYRGWTTVIPSPPGTANPVATVVITAPCDSTWWGIHVQCPRQLTAIESSTVSPLGTSFSTVCQKALTTSMYHVPVDNSGNSNPNSDYYGGSSKQFPQSYDPLTPGKFGQPDGVLGLHDWVFSDPNGVTPLPVGMYKVRFAPNAGGPQEDWVVEVGFREYKDVATYPPQTNDHALPPEGYETTNTGINVQSTGARIPGIVKSITPC